MKHYQIYGFSYINDENGRNTLNGTAGDDWDEVYEEYNIACFNGIAYFKSNCGCYKLTYPKLQSMTLEDKESVEFHNGYIPEAGEYGAICSTFGEVFKITEKEFAQLSKEYPIKKSDYQHFDWLNGNID